MQLKTSRDWYHTKQSRNSLTPTFNNHNTLNEQQLIKFQKIRNTAIVNYKSRTRNEIQHLMEGKPNGDPKTTTVCRKSQKMVGYQYTSTMQWSRFGRGRHSQMFYRIAAL